MTDIRGHIVRFIACSAVVFGGITLAPASAEAHRGPTYKRHHRGKAWQYRPNVWRHNRNNARRWRKAPRYRRIPRRPVYVPPRPRRLVGPGWHWVPAPPPPRYQRPRIYVVPQRPPVVVNPGHTQPGQPPVYRDNHVQPPNTGQPPQPNTVQPPQPAPAPRAPDVRDNGALPPDMDPNLPPAPAPAPNTGAVKPNPFGGNAPTPAPPAPAPANPRPDPFGGSNAPAPAPAPPAAPKTANPSSQLPAPDIKGILGDAQTGAIAAEVLRLVNIERAKKKLPALSNNIRLSTASWLHSQEMYVKRYFSHESPTKGRKQFTDRIRNAGVVKHGAAGENIAMTHVSRDVAKRLVKMWMDSPGHRANILHKDFRFSGLGIYGDGDYIYATQVFTQKVKTPGLNKRTRTSPKRSKPAVIGPTKVI